MYILLLPKTVVLLPALASGRRWRCGEVQYGRRWGCGKLQLGGRWVCGGSTI